VTDSQDVVATVRAFVLRVKQASSIDLDTSLYSDGIGLDSLESGELGAVLEDEYGTDPFQAGLKPETIRDIVAFYSRATPTQV
jgi:acyl carrier protein